MSDKNVSIVHPGIMLKEDFLEDLEVAPGAFAKAIGVDRSAIKNIIEGRRAITAEMAIRFGLFFGTTAGFWLNLQKDYELRMARRERLAEFQRIVKPFGAVGT